MADHMIEMIQKYRRQIIFCVVIMGIIFFLLRSSGESLFGGMKEEQIFSMSNNGDLLFQAESTTSLILAETEASMMIEKIYADIKGSVKHPGVYQIDEGSRLFELIELAGGLTEEAEPDWINQASLVLDQGVYYIYSFDEVNELNNSGNVHRFMESAEIGESNFENEQLMININTASQQELETLPGIGPSKALAIIEYRDKNGSFNRIDDLQEVSGIGVKTFEKLKELISVDQ